MISALMLRLTLHVTYCMFGFYFTVLPHFASAGQNRETVLVFLYKKITDQIVTAFAESKDKPYKTMILFPDEPSKGAGLNQFKEPLEHFFPKSSFLGENPSENKSSERVGGVLLTYPSILSSLQSDNLSLSGTLVGNSDRTTDQKIQCIVFLGDNTVSQFKYNPSPNCTFQWSGIPGEISITKIVPLGDYQAPKDEGMIKNIFDLLSSFFGDRMSLEFFH